MTELLVSFYESFKKLDADAMTSCYHDDVVFEDPAFGRLKGERAKAMWQMLCQSQKGKDFKIEFSDISYDEPVGTVHWEAFYTFSKTGRRVHNKIDAHFKFKDGLIIEHIDQFNLHRWAKQALGFKGAILGRTNYFKKRLQYQTRGMLQTFMDKKSAQTN